MSLSGLRAIERLNNARMIDNQRKNKPTGFGSSSDKVISPSGMRALQRLQNARMIDNQRKKPTGFGNTSDKVISPSGMQALQRLQNARMIDKSRKDRLVAAEKLRKERIRAEKRTRSKERMNNFFRKIGQMYDNYAEYQRTHPSPETTYNPQDEDIDITPTFDNSYGSSDDYSSPSHYHPPRFGKYRGRPLGAPTGGTIMGY